MSRLKINNHKKVNWIWLVIAGIVLIAAVVIIYVVLTDGNDNTPPSDSNNPKLPLVDDGEDDNDEQANELVKINFIDEDGNYVNKYFEYKINDETYVMMPENITNCYECLLANDEITIVANSFFKISDISGKYTYTDDTQKTIDIIVKYYPHSVIVTCTDINGVVIPNVQISDLNGILGSTNTNGQLALELESNIMISASHEDFIFNEHEVEVSYDSSNVLVGEKADSALDTFCQYAIVDLAGNALQNINLFTIDGAIASQVLDNTANIAAGYQKLEADDYTDLGSVTNFSSAKKITYADNEYILYSFTSNIVIVNNTIDVVYGYGESVDGDGYYFIIHPTTVSGTLTATLGTTLTATVYRNDMQNKKYGEGYFVSQKGWVFTSSKSYSKIAVTLLDGDTLQNSSDCRFEDVD